MRTTVFVVPLFLLTSQTAEAQHSPVSNTIALMSEVLVSERLSKNISLADTLTKSDLHETEAAAHTTRRTVIRPTDAELNAPMPEPTTVLTTAHLQYRSTIQLEGMPVSVEMSRQVKSENGQWIISEKTHSLFGNSLEINTIDQKSMKPLRKVLENGQLKIELDYAPKVIKGKIQGGSIDRIIALHTEQPILTDGAGLDLVLGSLPLKEGFVGYYRTFNPQSHQIKINQVKVVGVEQVNVPAGRFEAFKVEFKPINGDESTTFWIEKGRAVKMMTTLTHLNDAVMITELTQGVAN